MIDLHTLDSAKFVAHRVVGDLVQVLFAQPFAGNRGQYDRQASRLAGQGERIFDPRRQVEEIVGLQVHHFVDTA